MKRIIAIAAAALLTACSSAPKGDEAASTTITVFAAASLKGAFTEIGKQFEDANDGVSIRFSFAGSSDLVAQIRQGAPADVFASADTTNMDKATADNLVAGTPTDFATNTLEIATPAGNPAGVDSIDDLADADVKVVLCAAEVPCGSAAARVEKAAGIVILPVSEEQSVTDVLGKIITGEADAGLVYVTDVKSAGDKVHGVTFPESAHAVNTYPIATLAGSTNRDIAQAFVAFVAGPKGRAVLAAAGFAAP
ncbi:molybdate ABC transporter substrate-binding protein [Aeromicrobium panaciterrae]|uniref:molybdate ABC transporter substrate-binding protein n=1 Tax=Aeromicrobium panaciterrae TaxID=363861 RepID=UPI0031E18012